jgi:hypothetical protein
MSGMDVVPRIRWATMVWVQVVPDLSEVVITISSSRGTNRCQRVLSRR